MANFTDLAVNAEISGDKPFEQSFAPAIVHGLQIHFDPKAIGSPICTLRTQDGKTTEIRPHSSRTRKGRFSAHLDGDAVYESIHITTHRGKAARLMKVRLVGKKT